VHDFQRFRHHLDIYNATSDDKDEHAALLDRFRNIGAAGKLFGYQHIAFVSFRSLQEKLPSHFKDDVYAQAAKYAILRLT